MDAMKWKPDVVGKDAVQITLDILDFLSKLNRAGMRALLNVINRIIDSYFCCLTFNFSSVEQNEVSIMLSTPPVCEYGKRNECK